VHLLVEEALRCIVSPEPLASESEALAEMEALEAHVLKDLPWEEHASRPMTGAAWSDCCAIAPDRLSPASGSRSWTGTG
jgi:hypothetical protein